MPTLTLTAAYNAAMRSIAVLDSGGAGSTQQLADALEAANNMIDGWSIDRLMANFVLVTTQNLSANVAKYSIGTGQTFNQVLPSALEAASVLPTNADRTGLEVLNAVAWSMLPDRDSTSYRPKYIFFDRGSSAGGTTGSIYISPVPLSGTIELLTWSALTQFADATTPITISPGYKQVIEFGLALRLAPQYPGSQLPDSLKTDYADAIGALRQLNASLMGPEPPGGLIGPTVAPPIQPSAMGRPGSQ